MNSVDTMTEPVRLSTLLAGLTEVSDHSDCDVYGLSLDSREVGRGYLFLACSGGRTHGLNYVDNAISNGATAIVYEPDDTGAGSSITPETIFGADRISDENIPIISVPELSQHVGGIADRFFDHPSHALYVIAITGTNGKTTCSQLLAQALSALEIGGEVRPCGVIGTLGSGLYGDMQVGTHTTPDAVNLHATLARLRKCGAAWVVIEVSSHGLEQGRVNGVHFDIAVFTNLSRDHLDYHRDMESYGRAKRRLFDMPGLRSAVINSDDEFGRHLMESIPSDVQILTFGLDPWEMPESDKVTPGSVNFLGNVHGSDLILDRSGMRMCVDTPWGEAVLQSPLLGRFNASNALTVLSVLLLIGVRFDDALSCLAEADTIPGRMEGFGGKDGRPLVVVDYAHTPDALAHALQALREQCAGRLWCVFGCGGERDRGKRPVMGRVAESTADQVIVTDDNPRSEDGNRIVEEILAGMKGHESALVIRDRAQAVAHAINLAQEEDIVLVAGKGHEEYQLVNGQHLPLSDRKLVGSLLGGVMQ